MKLLGLHISQERDNWAEEGRQLDALFRTRTREEWCSLLEGTDACFAPVLSPSEARQHPHNVARGTFVDVDGVPQPGPAPRFSVTPGEVARPAAAAGAHTDEILNEWGLREDEIAVLRDEGAIF
jgi:alpha-methylacyl-CoA racemase